MYRPHPPLVPHTSVAACSREHEGAWELPLFHLGPGFGSESPEWFRLGERVGEEMEGGRAGCRAGPWEGPTSQLLSSLSFLGCVTPVQRVSPPPAASPLASASFWPCPGFVPRQGLCLLVTRHCPPLLTTGKGPEAQRGPVTCLRSRSSQGRNWGSPVPVTLNLHVNRAAPLWPGPCPRSPRIRLAP